MCRSCATASVTAKYYDAFPADGVGDMKPITVNTVLLVTSDAVADHNRTTATITLVAVDATGAPIPFRSPPSV